MSVILLEVYIAGVFTHFAIDMATSDGRHVGRNLIMALMWPSILIIVPIAAAAVLWRKIWK